MVEEHVNPERQRGGLAARLDSVGWALFFIWVGVALLLDVGWGIGLLGVGAITLGGQAARMTFGLRLEGFWAILGIIFLLGGIWELYGITVPLLPLLLIAAGVAVIIGAFAGRHLAGRTHG